MSEQKRWTVHINFTDGTKETVNGDPNVIDDVLMVQVVSPGFPDSLLFEAGYPLRHVKWWWVDYEDDEMVDAARSGPTR